jgi:hypothetical protein
MDKQKAECRMQNEEMITPQRRRDREDFNPKLFITLPHRQCLRRGRHFCIPEQEGNTDRNARNRDTHVVRSPQRQEGRRQRV